MHFVIDDRDAVNVHDATDDADVSTHILVLMNRSSTLELLFAVLKNTFELLLSSERDQFEFEKVDFDDFRLFSNEIPTVGTKGNTMKIH